MMMKLLMIVLLTGSLKSDHLCGPEECGLYCDEDQVCSQDYEVKESLSCKGIWIRPVSLAFKEKRYLNISPGSVHHLTMLCSVGV